VCSGDSGGPALDAQNRVLGVVSRGAPGCESPVYTSVFGWRDWIMSVVKTKSQDTGFVVPDWADGGSSDPSTSWPVGGPCNDNNGCYSGICIDGYCSRNCTEDAPCPEGYACLPDEGYCVLPPVGTPCDDDTACDGGVCVDGMCTRPCIDSAPCPEGYVCDADSGLCGPIPLGEPCNGALDCATLMCVDGYCTRQCDDATPCPQPFGCESGICLPTPLGDSCNADGECASSLCVEGVCTRRCDEIDCDAPWSCDAATELCVPPPDPEETPGDDGCPVEPCDEPGGVGGGPAFPGGDLPCIGIDCDEASTDDPASSPSGTEGCVGEDCEDPPEASGANIDDGPMELSGPSSSGCAAGGGLDGALFGLVALGFGVARRRRREP
jgi:MYXO-CTERM domain-containing protein